MNTSDTQKIIEEIKNLPAFSLCRIKAPDFVGLPWVAKIQEPVPNSISYPSPLDLASSGATKEEAQERFKEILIHYIEHKNKRKNGSPVFASFDLLYKYIPYWKLLSEDQSFIKKMEEIGKHIKPMPTSRNGLPFNTVACAAYFGGESSKFIDAIAEGDTLFEILDQETDCDQVITNKIYAAIRSNPSKESNQVKAVVKILKPVALSIIKRDEIYQAGNDLIINVVLESLSNLWIKAYNETSKQLGRAA